MGLKWLIQIPARDCRWFLSMGFPSTARSGGLNWKPLKKPGGLSLPIYAGTEIRSQSLARIRSICSPGMWRRSLDHLESGRRSFYAGCRWEAISVSSISGNTPIAWRGWCSPPPGRRRIPLRKRAGRDQSASNVLKNGVAPLAEGMLPLLLSPQTEQSNPALVAAIAGILNGTSVEGTVGALQAMRDRPDSTSTLTEINLPTLVIHGAEDRIIPFQEAEKMASRIPHGRLVKIQNAGHLLNMEKPAEFNAAFKDFLETL